MRVPTSCLASLAVVLLSGAARADMTPEQAAARRDLISQAQTARDAGQHARSLDLALRAGAVQMTVSLRRFISEEYAAAGDVARALGSAELCTREARAAGPDAEPHLTACQALVDQTRSRVGYVVARPAHPVQGLSVKIAGSDVPSSLYGERYPVTPGDVDVDAAAPGYHPLHLRLHVDAGVAPEVALDLIAEPAQPPPPPSLLPSPPPPTRETKMSLLVPVGGGAAVVGFVVAGAVWLVANGKLNGYKSQCVTPDAPAPKSCAGEHDSLQSTLSGYAVVIDVGLVVGLVGAAVGATGLFLPRAAEPTTPAAVGMRF